MWTGTDQVIQPIGRWHLHAVLDQEIYAAIKDQARLEMHPRLRRDLNGQGIAGRVIKGLEAIVIKNNLLMPLPRAVRVLNS